MRAISLLLILLLSAISTVAQTPKLKKGDRKIVGDQLDYGRKAAEFGLWNEAIFHWEKIIARDPKNSSAMNNLAVAYESVGAYEKAEALYRTALDLNEDNAEIRKNMKRFNSFYRKHKRQLEREQRVKIKSKGQKEGPEAKKPETVPEPQPKPLPEPSDDEEADPPHPQQGGAL